LYFVRPYRDKKVVILLCIFVRRLNRRLSAVIRVSTEFGGAISCCSDSIIACAPCIAQVRLVVHPGESCSPTPMYRGTPANLERDGERRAVCLQNASCCVRLACR
jgi:hypothetical protein